VQGEEEVLARRPDSYKSEAGNSMYLGSRKLSTWNISSEAVPRMTSYLFTACFSGVAYSYSASTAKSGPNIRAAMSRDSESGNFQCAFGLL
jgi:hypothetical protein